MPFRPNPGFGANVDGLVQRIGNRLSEKTRARIQQNIVDKDRILTGRMRDSTYAEQIAPNRWRIGVRGPHYTIFQEEGTRPREGNRGIIGAHFVRDAKTALENGDL